MTRHPLFAAARAAFFSTLLAAVACGGGGASRHALDGLLRVDHVQAKGTHNSYHVAPAEPLPSIIVDWAYTQPTLTEQLDLHGVRQVELDVHFQLAEGRLAVYHLPLIDPRTVCFWLADCLTEMRAWSDAHPDHLPLLVLIEPKDDIDLVKLDDHMGELDRDILATWPLERIVTPDRIRGGAATIGEGLDARGWPTLGEARGQAIFVLNDSSELRDRYVDGDPTLAGRPMFVRYESLDDPNAAVLVLDDAEEDSEAVRAAVLAHRLVRSTGDLAPRVRAGDFAERDAALATGSHYISTDFPAPTGPGGYGFEVPGGSPARCNPVSAPPECTAEAIEDLAR